jgi:hypothetical protein
MFHERYNALEKLLLLPKSFRVVVVISDDDVSDWLRDVDYRLFVRALPRTCCPP